MATRPDFSTLDQYKYGFHDDIQPVFKSKPGLSHEVVEEISYHKEEPAWMREHRLKALDTFLAKPMPTWGGDLSELNFDDIYYYVKPSERSEANWDEVPEEIKNTFDKLGIPEAERQFLGGIGAQYDSEVVYHSLREQWEKQGVVFVSPEEAVREHPDLVQQYFGTVIPATDNKFAALNTAVWSGGSFIYVPPGVHVDIPLQAYFRINTEKMGQFERTLIIADEGSFVHYVEGCTAPVYSKDSLHSAVVEIIVKKGARVRYTTIQNWSTNVYNLVTKRAVAHEGATMEWVDGNLGCLAQGSRITTPNGVKAIEDVEVGEEVLSYDEPSGSLCFHPVTAKRYSGRQRVRPATYGTRVLYVTDNHPFYSYRYDPDRPRKLGRYQLAYVRADELEQAIVPATSLDYGVPHPLWRPAATVETTFETRNQYQEALTVTRSRATTLTAPETTTTDLMWLFGYFVGDGNIDRQMASTPGVTRWAKVGFSTPATDRARQKLLRIMDPLGLSEPTERGDGVHLAWNSVELADFFERNGFGTGALTKAVPEWVYNLPEPQRLAFIAGYLDADGCVVERRFHIKSANKQLLSQVGELLTSLGLTGRLHTIHDEPRPVEICGYQAVASASYCLAFPIDPRLFPYLSEALREEAQAVEPPSLQHHRLIGRSSIDLPESVEVVKVEVGEPGDEPQPTWDIEVAGTGNFVSEGFIVHNSRLTMKYPAVYMVEPGAHGEVLSIAFAGRGQHQDAGGKVVHAAPNTTSKISSKSISKNGGRASYRGLLKVYDGAENAKSNVVCDALLLDERSRSDTYPTIEIDEEKVTVGHEASVSKVGEEQLFYLRSRGLGETEAINMIVNGFIEPIVKELPMEYAVELNRLIELQMEGSIG